MVHSLTPWHSREFARPINGCGQTELSFRLSEQAETNAADDGVKDLAHMLIVDHVAAAVKLKTTPESKADRPETLSRVVLAPWQAPMLRQLEERAAPSSTRSISTCRPRAFPVKSGSPEMLYLFVQTQFRTQNRFPLLLELL